MNKLPRVLIIDDEPIIRDTLESLLAVEDMELYFAENGESGLSLAQQFLPDAILLDVMMPGMDGYETCRQIRANPALAEIPVIMVTALDDRNARLTGLKAGADDFLTKPFDGLEIQIRIKNIVRLNRYRNLIAERSRFRWVVDNAEKGYLILDGNGNIQYANQRAQVYLHLPEAYTQINFARQAERYYQSHIPDANGSEGASGNTSYLVQPESAIARAFWLRVDELNSTFEVDHQRLLRISDVTDEMSAYQDIRKIHLMVAHKLRTPVAIIYNIMSLLDSKLDLIPDKEVRPMVKDAWNGAERLMTQILDILRYIDAPIAYAEGNPFQLCEMQAMIATASKALELMDVVTSMPDALTECKLNISANAMDLIIHEILENSKKFHPRKTPHVQVRVELHGQEQVKLQFFDDGQGMTAEQINRAKLPYSQGEKWFTGEVAGMGLGIPLIEILVWQAGGQIRIANREDQSGICVSLILPVLK